MGIMATTVLEGLKQWPRTSKTFPYHDGMMSDTEFDASAVDITNVVFQVSSSKLKTPTRLNLVIRCYHSI